MGNEAGSEVPRFGLVHFRAGLVDVRLGSMEPGAALVELRAIFMDSLTSA